MAISRVLVTILATILEKKTHFPVVKFHTGFDISVILDDDDQK